MAQIHIGTSGYSYKHWKGVFYPEKLSDKEWLDFYVKYLASIEINSTFLRLPNRAIFEGWGKRTPENFTFTLKGPRVITHFKKLSDSENSLNHFFETISPLSKKIKVILWQIPPDFEYDPIRFKKFCETLTKIEYKFAFEFRNLSWFNEEVYEQLFTLNAAVVQCDSPFYVTEGDHFEIQENLVKVPETADFAYIRRHGASATDGTSYSTKQLVDDAESIFQTTKNNREIYEYFNNDAEGNAVKNAMELAEILKNNYGL